MRFVNYWPSVAISEKQTAVVIAERTDGTVDLQVFSNDQNGCERKCSVRPAPAEDARKADFPCFTEADVVPVLAEEEVTPNEGDVEVSAGLGETPKKRKRKTE